MSNPIDDLTATMRKAQAEFKPIEDAGWAQMKRKEAEDLSQMTYNIIFLNDMVLNCFIDMKAEVKSSGYYRHKVKQTLNKAEAERKRYESMMHDIVKDRFEQDFADMNDAYTESFHKDLQLLLFSIKGFLDKKKIEDSFVKAHVYRTLIMSNIAVHIFKHRQKEIKALRTVPCWASLDFLNLDKMHYLCDELARLMGYYEVKGHCENTQKVVDIIIDKLSDGQLVFNALL